ARDDQRAPDSLHLDSEPLVDSVKPTLAPYKLVGREIHPHDTIVELGGTRVGGGRFTVIAGPCAVESLEQMRATARAVQAGGAHALRGGAYKPRTSPYSFQGLGQEGLAVLKQRSHLPVLVDPSHGTGLRELVTPMAKAALACGADGILVEVHCDPPNALSDGRQSLFPEEFAAMMRELRPIADAVGKVM